MAIKDLEVRQGNVDVVLEIVEVGEAREFQKFGKSGKVASATAKDETGEIKLSLWNEQVDQVKAGDKVHITNGYVSEFQGEKQLTTGKFGKLEVVGKVDESQQSSSEAETKPEGGVAPAAEPKEDKPEAPVKPEEESIVDKSQQSSSEAETISEEKEETVSEEKVM